MIRNDSPRVIAGAKAMLRVDDKPTELKLPEIAPERSTRVPLCGAVSRSRAARISRSSFPTTSLPGDNQRWAAVPVKDSLLIRLVDGEPSSEPFGSEVDYLAAPLSIGIGAAEAWRVEVGARAGFPVAAARDARRAGPGQRRAPITPEAGRAARVSWCARAWG